MKIILKRAAVAVNPCQFFYPKCHLFKDFCKYNYVKSFHKIFKYFIFPYNMNLSSNNFIISAPSFNLRFFQNQNRDSCSSHGSRVQWRIIFSTINTKHLNLLWLQILKNKKWRKASLIEDSISIKKGSDEHQKTAINQVFKAVWTNVQM